MSKSDDFFAKLAVSKRFIDKLDEIPRGDASGQRQSTPTPKQKPTPRPRPTQQVQGSYRNLESSNMPDFIKEAMVNQPIVNQPLGSAFSINDIPEDFNGGVMNENVQQRPQFDTSSMVGLTEAEVRDIVRDEMINYFVDYFKETIKENTEKNLIKDMINKGIIKKKRK